MLKFANATFCALQNRLLQCTREVANMAILPKD